jgi:hypothetical protein
MQRLLVVVLVAVVACGYALAQQDGEYELALAKIGQGQQYKDVNPFWSPDGQWIAFTRILDGTGKMPYSRLGFVKADATPTDKPYFIYNMEAMGWTPDSKKILCVNRAVGKMPTVPDVWAIDVDDPTKISYYMPTRNPMFFDFSPDKKKRMLVQQAAPNFVEILVSTGDGEFLPVYNVREPFKFLQAGWTDTSDAIFLLMEQPIKGTGSINTGTPINDIAEGVTETPPLVISSGEESMMGEGAMENMGGEGMGMENMNAPPPEPTVVHVLYKLNLVDGTKTKIEENVEWCAWSPTEPYVVMLRRLSRIEKVEAPPGAEMMGMEGGGGPSYKVIVTEYLAARRPDETTAQERRIPDLTLPVRNPRYSPTGLLAGGFEPNQRRAFAFDPKAGPMLEIAQNVDDSNKDVLRGSCWSPDGTKMAYSGLEGTEERNGRYIIRGIYTVDVASGATHQVTSNKNKYVPPKPAATGYMMP